MTVRRAEAGDLEAILAISNRAAVETAANFAIEPEPIEAWRCAFDEQSAMHPWFVALVDGAVAGFARSTPWKGRCAYSYSAETSVYVLPEAHRRGLGRALYGALLPTLDAQGYRTLLAGITQPNEASVRLHESFGFRPCAMFERIGWKFGRWHDVGYWIRHAGEGAPPASIRRVDDVLA